MLWVRLYSLCIACGRAYRLCEQRYVVAPGVHTAEVTKSSVFWDKGRVVRWNSRACTAHAGEDECMQSFGGKARRKETTRRKWLSTDYTTLYHRRQYSSKALLSLALTHYLHGAQLLLSSFQSLSYSGISQYFTKPEVSLSCSQEPSNCTHPEPDQSSPYHTILSILALSHHLHLGSPICIHLLPHSCYMPCPSHPPWLDHSNYTWRRVQVMTPIWRHSEIKDSKHCTILTLSSMKQ
jgi:hypothetical protein